MKLLNALKITTVFLSLIIVLGTASLFAWSQMMNAPGPSTERQLLYIQPGAGLNMIAKLAEDKGLVHSARLFRLAVYSKQVMSRLRAGEFELAPHSSLNQIVETFVNGKPYQRYITFPEGISVKQAELLLNEAEGFAPYAQGREVVAMKDSLVELSEGSLLPETYSYHRGDSKTDVLHRAQTAMTTLVDQLWQNRALDLPIKTKSEAVILASIVEKETSLDRERPLVASVFINRLRQGMRLQSDPTVIYGITFGLPLGRAIRRSDLRAQNEYNTYRINGLPVTPIANPGRASLEAVLNPPQTDYLYFVASGNGGHHFAKTLRQHNKNVAKWRALNRAKAAD